MKKFILIILAVFSFALTVSGCNPPNKENQSLPEDQISQNSVPDNQLPPDLMPPTPLFTVTCTANDLDSYSFCKNGLSCSPEGFEWVFTSTPTFEWEGLSCQPSAYKVKVYQFPNILVFEGFAPVSQNINGLETIVTVNNPPLALGRQFFWSVTPILNGVEYPTFSIEHFFTGPVCGELELVAPDLISPADGAIVTSDHPPLNLDYAPECLPNIFKRELSTDPNFEGSNLMAQPDVPSFTQIPKDLLQDCTTYYWRAKSVIQNSASPWSQTFSFTTNFNNGCPEESEPLGECTFMAMQNLFCREGPGQAYEALDSFTPGQSALVVGQGIDGYTVYVISPNFGLTCNVPSESPFGELSGDCSDLASVLPPPTSLPPTLIPVTLTPTPCSRTAGCP